MKFQYLRPGRKVCVAAALSLIATVGAPVHADTIAFSNLSAGNGSFGRVGSASNPFGELFQSGAAGNLTSATLALGYLFTNQANTPFNLSIYSDNSSGQIGSLLDTMSGDLTIQDQNHTVGSPFNDLVTLTSTAHPYLSSGGLYWFVVSDQIGASVWRATDGAASLGDYANGQYNPVGLASSALSFSVAPVPLPPAAWLMLSGLAGLAGWARRRRAAAAE
jgi:hypothetical protein